MSTPRELHKKILEISSKYISGKPPIYVSSIAEEMGVEKNILSEHIVALKALNFIEYKDPVNEIIALTDSGKYANP